LVPTASGVGCAFGCVVEQGRDHGDPEMNTTANLDACRTELLSQFAATALRQTQTFWAAIEH
jgi:hypothetical protein